MIRLTEQERDRLHAAAKAAGFGKTATWARGVLMGRTDAAPSSSTRSDFEPFRRELARIGSNLNQMARALNVTANSGGTVGHQVAAELDHLTRETRRLREAIEAATR